VAGDDVIRKYVDAAVVLGQITKSKAEEFLKEFREAHPIPDADGDDLVERGIRAGERALKSLRSEIDERVQVLGVSSLQDLVRQVGDLWNAPSSESPTHGGGPATAKKANEKTGAFDPENPPPRSTN
jgi:hypothetical protein